MCWSYFNTRSFLFLLSLSQSYSGIPIPLKLVNLNCQNISCSKFKPDFILLLQLTITPTFVSCILRGLCVEVHQFSIAVICKLKTFCPPKKPTTNSLHAGLGLATILYWADKDHSLPECVAHNHKYHYLKKTIWTNSLTCFTVKQDDLQKIFLPHQPASLWEGEFPELAKNKRIFLQVCDGIIIVWELTNSFPPLPQPIAMHKENNYIERESDLRSFPQPGQNLKQVDNGCFLIEYKLKSNCGGLSCKLLYYMWKHFLLPQLQRQKGLSSWVLTTSPHISIT